MASPPLFDERARALRRARAGLNSVEHIFADRALADLLDRIGDNNRRFERALLVGALDPRWAVELGRLVGQVEVVDPSPALATGAGGQRADEHVLPSPDGRFDLVVAAGTLDTAADLPAALTEIRRVLVPDGHLLGAVAGAGSLPRLRAAMLAADELTGAAAPRIHPALDPRTMGDLLARAGFVLTVVDLDRLRVGYNDPLTLVGDLRAHAATNILARRSRRPFGREALRTLRSAFAAEGERTYEEVNILHFSGWTPGPNQPQPAKRGSATVSLSSALGKAPPAPR